MQIEGMEIPDYVKGLIAEPAVLEGEDPNLFWKIFVEIAKERKPESPSDWIMVSDLAGRLWDERVCRRAANAIVKAGKMHALRQVLDVIGQGEPRLPSSTAVERVKRYFAGSEKERAEIRSILATYGIGDAELHAIGAQYNSDALMMFERMIASRERYRRKLRKEDRARRSRSDSEPGNLGK